MSAPKEQPRGDEEGKEQHVVAAQAATQGKEGGDGSDGEKKQVRVLTTEEAAMLDDDEFFKAYKEGRIQRRPGHWTEENFEEEMEKHPLFMTHEPTKEEYVNNPHLSALQEMFAELTPIERADHHKTHGNEAYKKARAAGKNKKLKEAQLKKAIHYYTEGLREMCGDDKVDSILLGNRAMCNLLLRNNGSALKDCKLAVRFNPDNIKAYYRAASACMNLERYTECIQWCDDVLGRDPSNADTVEMRKKAVKLKAAQEKAARKAAAEARRAKKHQQTIMTAINDRGIRLLSGQQVEWGDYFHHDDDDDDEEEERPQSLLPTHTNGPTIDSNHVLHWPVLFLYPEHAQTDFIQEFDERTAFEDHLKLMFPDEPSPSVPWDNNNTYKWNRLQIYFEEVDAQNTRTKRLIPIDKSKALLEVLVLDAYAVRGMVPFFIIVVKGSEHEKRFTSEYTIVN